GNLEMSVGTGLYLRSFSPRRAFLFHNGMAPKNAAPLFPVVYVSVQEQFWAIGHLLCRKMFLDRHPGTWAEIIDLERPLNKWRIPPDTRPSLLQLDLLTRGLSDDRAWLSQGRFWRQIVMSPRYRLVFSALDTSTAKVRVTRQEWNDRILLTCVMILLGVRFLMLMIGHFSLRTRLLLLFLYTTAIPLIMLGVSAQAFVSDRRENLERRTFRHAENVLRKVDDSALEQLSRFERRGRAMERLDLPSGDAARDLVASLASEMARELRPTYALFSGEKGKEVFQHLPDRTNRSGQDFSHQLKKITPLFTYQVARRMADLNRRELPPSESAREQAISATIESLGIDIGQFVTHMEDFTGRIYSVAFGNIKTFGYGFFIQDLSGLVRFGTWFVWVEDRLFQFFCDSVREFQKKVPDWCILLGYQVFPDTRSNPAPITISRILSRLEWDPLPQHATEQVGTETLLISGTWSERVVRHRLLCAQPDTPIRTDLAAAQRRLTLVASLLLLSGIIVGFLLSRHLLGPVRELGQGIEAVRHRDFRVRLPVHSPDELGQLGETFNRVVEGLGELETAKVVQETLFPSATLDRDAWEVSGFCRTASRIGGDYYDYFRLADGRWLLMIGDVSGHGTAAALVVAMAKVVVCHSATPPDPVSILELMNRELVQTVKRRRMMTCFVAIFDPTSRVMIASNAGHSFPLKVSDRRVEEVKIEHPLLGAKIRTPFPRHEIRLLEGDSIIFYTDGLVETLDRDGQQIGYDRFAAALPELMRPTATETTQAILDWRSQLAGSPALEDDVTVMALQSRRHA
ncbi:MAG TPA: SpoIIE family protein phosphatase, partial [Candidatus Ozemobacteraceae bacterium]|nr:SpoIIE family protein phosphatase [Candidatus Ozemobacteraceae bacterium]